MKQNEREKREDPVARMVCDLSAQEMVDWLIEYHGLDKSSAQTVEMNLREQFKWHRLQGRLDREDLAKTMAELIGCYRSPMLLETPDRTPPKED